MQFSPFHYFVSVRLSSVVDRVRRLVLCSESGLSVERVSLRRSTPGVFFFPLTKATVPFLFPRGLLASFVRSLNARFLPLRWIVLGVDACGGELRASRGFGISLDGRALHHVCCGRSR